MHISIDRSSCRGATGRHTENFLAARQIISEVFSGRSAEDPLAALVQDAIDGNPEALRGLLRALAPEIARVARAILGPTSPSLDDAVQDALLALVHALPSFRRDCSARRFANRIAARTALANRRRARSFAQRDSLASETYSQPAPSQEQHTIAGRRRALVRRLLDELPERQAEVLSLRIVLGYSLEETAATVQAPVNTVRSRVRLAKEALRQRISDDPSMSELLEDGP
jgi:RNA polymerase sigma-70 factor (ECF subfamily)